MRSLEPASRFAALTLSAITMSCLLFGTHAHGSEILSFQEGADGYTGTLDTWITNDTTTASQGAATTVAVRRRGGAGNQRVGLIRFDNIFGLGSGQIDPSLDSTDIVSATLKLYFTAVDTSKTVTVNLANQTWNESSTTSSLGLTDANPSLMLGTPVTSIDMSDKSPNSWIEIDVTDNVRSWLTGGNNHGWGLWETVASGSSPQQFASSEYTSDTLFRPILEVTIIPEPASLALMGLGGLLVLSRSRPRQAV